jgi:hypothetical protein
MPIRFAMGLQTLEYARITPYVAELHEGMPWKAGSCNKNLRFLSVTCPLRLVHSRTCVTVMKRVVSKQLLHCSRFLVLRNPKLKILPTPSLYISLHFSTHSNDLLFDSLLQGSNSLIHADLSSPRIHCQAQYRQAT